MNKAKRRILLIDDNFDTIDLIEVFLYRQFSLVTAENGFEGLKTAKEIVPDLILTDIMMPVMDGIRFFNELRKLELVAAVPVIAMTSFLKKVTTKSLLNMGFNGVLAKPVEREKLLAAIASVLPIVAQ